MVPAERPGQGVGAVVPAARRIDILRRALELAELEEPFVTMIVVKSTPPSVMKAGDKAFIMWDGRVEGWIGGSCVEEAIVREALETLKEDLPRVKSFETCHGGLIEVYLEPYQPPEKVVLIGQNPIVAALTRFARELGLKTVWVAEEERDVKVNADVTIKPEDLDVLKGRIYAVIATMGRKDHVYAERLLQKSNVEYIGVVASKARWKDILEYLKSRGFTEKDMSKIRSPAGMNIGARTPEEIALSIIAEIIMYMRRGGAEYTMARAEETRAANIAEPASISVKEAAAIITTDPVCGMYVDPSSARYSIQVEGYTVLFCSPYCLEAFKKNEQAYLEKIKTLRDKR